MKILHTSDWHLGRTLYGRKRYEEFSLFLDWLMEIIESDGIEALLIAGDVFDSSTPSNRAQELYYQFLSRVSRSCCRHVIVIAGNHDSPSFLEAPKQLLRALNVHVVGAISESIDDELLILSAENKPEAIICAVPYLRDKDIRTTDAGETIDEKNAKLVEGIKKHYGAIARLAEQKQEMLQGESYGDLPIIALGHLFTAGGITVEGDAVRELYVGSLAHIGSDAFPACIDYLALGHLHVPQIVGGKNHHRYSGSPIPMGYGEANQDKKVVIVTFSGRVPTIEDRVVPRFQELVRVTGTLEEILNILKNLKEQSSRAWVEVEYTGKESAPHLREEIEKFIEGTQMEIRRIRDRRVMERALTASVLEQTLSDLDEMEVFSRCLTAFDVPKEQHDALIASYSEIVKSIDESDNLAE